MMNLLEKFSQQNELTLHNLYKETLSINLHVRGWVMNFGKVESAQSAIVWAEICERQKVRAN